MNEYLYCAKLSPCDDHSMLEMGFLIGLILVCTTLLVCLIFMADLAIEVYKTRKKAENDAEDLH